MQASTYFYIQNNNRKNQTDIFLVDLYHDFLKSNKQSDKTELGETISTACPGAKKKKIRMDRQPAVSYKRKLQQYTTLKNDERNKRHICELMQH